MIKIGGWLSEGWNILNKDMGTFVIATVLMVIGTVISLSILFFPLTFGMYYMALRSMRGSPVSVGDLSFGFQRFGKALLLWVLFIGVVVILSVAQRVSVFFSVLSLVVNPYLGWLIALVGYQIVDRDAEFGKAISNAIDLFKKDWIMFWVSGLVFSIVSGIGVIACGVGVFVTAPWVMCAFAVAYRDLFVGTADVTIEATRSV